MSKRIAFLATAVVLAFGTAPSFAATYHSGSAMAPASLRAGMVSQATIDAGPQLPDGAAGDSSDWAQAELTYLQKVCPTVLAHPGTEKPRLVEFCKEPHG